MVYSSIIKVMIVDDHLLFREGLAEIVSIESSIQVVGYAGMVREAVEAARKCSPDVILMDFELPDGTGADASRAILAENPGVKILFLTMYDDEQNLHEAIKSGAKGYLLKNARTAELIAGIKAVQRGDGALSPSIIASIMNNLSNAPEAGTPQPSQIASLTRQERVILKELAQDASNLEIAQHLGVSTNTVKRHVHSVLQKLDLPNRKIAGSFARRHKLF